MKQGNCTQVFFIMTYWPHDMLQAVCDKFAEVVNDFISKKGRLKEPPRVWNNLRTPLYLAFTSPTLRSWDTLQVWASFHRPSYKPEGPLPSS
mmetsp:Transcript_34018/g.97975  ORF Transcript_34018/g.97975 Transcript_34018/m.97975 type:complete len:92 (-) Transcript_34018:528-803(-)